MPPDSRLRPSPSESDSRADAIWSPLGVHLPGPVLSSQNVATVTSLRAEAEGLAASGQPVFAFFLLRRKIFVSVYSDGSGQGLIRYEQSSAVAFWNVILMSDREIRIAAYASELLRFKTE